MKEIKLTQGKVAIVDDEDFEYLNQWKWFYCRYAKRTYREGESNRVIGIKRPKLYERMHRVIVKCPEGLFVDHIDGNPLNNQKSNLRICTLIENSKNRKSKTGSTSDYLGVSLRKYIRPNKTYFYWEASIFSNKKITHLGHFPYTPEGEIMAAKTYNEHAVIHHGAFARLNNT